MSDTEFDPRENPELKSLVQKAIWIVRTFGYWRWSPVPLPVRTGIYPKKLRNNFIFEWENIRINAFQTVPIPKDDHSDLLQDEDPNLIISLKRERETRLLGIIPIRLHRFQEIFVSDFSGEVKRLKIPVGADLAEIQAVIGNLHDAFKKLPGRSGMTTKQIKALPHKALAKLLEDGEGSNPSSLMRKTTADGDVLELMDMKNKALFIVQTAGNTRHAFQKECYSYDYTPLNVKHAKYFEYGPLRIEVYETKTFAGERNVTGPFVQISIKKESKISFFNHFRRFKTINISGVTGELYDYPKVDEKFLEEMGNTVDRFYNIFQKLINEDGMTREDIIKIPRDSFAKILQSNASGHRKSG